MLDRVKQQETLCEVHRQMMVADKIFKKAIWDSENFDVDLIYDSIDNYKNALNLIHEKDPEIEAIISAHLGRIFYKGLKLSAKARLYYLDCIRLLETLKPKTYFDHKWHQLMMKHMDEIIKANLDAE